MKKILLLIIFTLGITLYSLETDITNKSGNIITVTSTTELTDQQQNLVLRTYEMLTSWEELVIEEIKFIYEEDKLSVLLSISSLIYQSTELSKYMPSGIQFYYETFYEYDFRMFKDSLFMRLKGQYFSKENLFEEIYKAAEDPILYVQVHDPSYLIRQIDGLREVNNQQNKAIDDLINMNNELKENLTKSTAESIKTLTQNTTDSINNITAAIIALDNRNFWGKLADFNKDVVPLIIEIKTDNPQITVKEVVKQLKNNGVTTTSKTVEAVFILYF